MIGEKHNIGYRIKEKRKTQNMSLEDLSKATEIPIDVLKSIENEDVTPSLNPLSRISRALGARIGTFLDNEPREDPIIIKNNTKTQEEYFTNERYTNNTNMEYFSLATGKTDRHMEPLIVNINQKHQIIEYSHEGEEFIYILKGTVNLQYGKKEYTLTEGNSAYYDSIVPHKINSINNNNAKVLAILYTPID